MSEVKHYWPEEIVGTGELVVYLADYAALEAERDELRQQLTELDATVERLEAGIPRLQEQAYQARKQRDKLAGLLADVKADYAHAIHWEDMHAIMKRIDAALAEVKPCPESLHPAVD